MVIYTATFLDIIKYMVRLKRYLVNISTSYSDLLQSTRDTVKFCTGLSTALPRAPKVSINYTNAGQSRIWFIRSPFNRKARQSKKLTGIIIKARLRAQDNLDRFRECESKLFYAFQEAQWEYTLIHKQPCSRKFNDVVTQIKSGKSNDIPAVFIDWIKPILEDMDILNRINANTQRKFTESRDHLIDGKQYEYYKQLNQRLYKKRLERFLGLKAELPTTNPFTEEKNLGALLVKWRFLRPDQLVKVKS